MIGRLLGHTQVLIGAKRCHVSFAVTPHVQLRLVLPPSQKPAVEIWVVGVRHMS